MKDESDKGGAAMNREQAHDILMKYMKGTGAMSGLLGKLRTGSMIIIQLCVIVQSQRALLI